MIDSVESELRGLQEPVPPATLAGAVMARVSRLADARGPAALPSRAPAGISRVERARNWNDLAACVAALAGLTIVLVSWIVARLDAGSWLEPIPSQVAAPNLVRLPPDGLAVLWLTLGVLLYVAGLFAPVRNSHQPHRP